MLALSLWQPWASLVASGVKHHETRHWRTSYRGWLAVHAAKRRDCGGEGLVSRYLPERSIESLPRGAFVAIAWLRDCLSTEAVRPDVVDEDCGDWTPGRYAWRLTRLIALPVPVVGRGQQGLWRLDADTELRLRASCLAGFRQEPTDG